MRQGRLFICSFYTEETRQIKDENVYECHLGLPSASWAQVKISH